MNKILLFLSYVAEYAILIGRIFRKIPPFKIFRDMLMRDIDNIFWSSLPIVVVISVFMGAVATIQTAANIESPLIPIYATGFTVRQSIILELSPTVIALILAGKLGSYVTSELGTMKITEQIDALNVMGLNSVSFLVLPKLIASLIGVPLLVAISMILAILSGWFISVATGIVTSYEFMYGMTYDFRPFHVFYSLIKSEFFAFSLITISSFFGFKVEGSSVNVGKNATYAVVTTGIVILGLNYVITQLLLL